ncbi:MarR family winged helix-turn-helix transcriptional regulator [Demequina gelatinilytica]|uniref:MarR family winged helix-turn-helix transcriptional regulator n=1 Tax=Demequina gelatinilytica TaxID=1638980 RepID=UPI000780890F|nr:MarR family winged helix-turn-helix transcriptional regulator [Demequina gelatinilytica]
MTTRVPRMNEAESRAWLALVGTSQLLPAALDAQLQADSGITHFEFMALSALNTAPELTLRTSDLAVRTYATLPRLSKVVSRMEARGLVERVPCPGDARASNIRLTRDGRKELLLALPGHLSLVRAEVLGRLSEGQLEALAEALEPVLEALADDPRFPWARGASRRAESGAATA